MYFVWRYRYLSNAKFTMISVLSSKIFRDVCLYSYATGILCMSRHQQHLLLCIIRHQQHFIDVLWTFCSKYIIFYKQGLVFWIYFVQNVQVYRDWRYSTVILTCSTCCMNNCNIPTRVGAVGKVHHCQVGASALQLGCTSSGWNKRNKINQFVFVLLLLETSEWCNIYQVICNILLWSGTPRRQDSIWMIFQSTWAGMTRYSIWKNKA